MIISNFAETMERYGDSKEALKHYKEALRVLDANGSSNGTKIVLLKKVAELSMKHESIDNAIEYIKEAKHIVENSVD
jgi:hypothetical protein